MVGIKNSLFIEPNAITRVDSGRLFDRRFLLSEPDGDARESRRDIPQSFPVRFLSLRKIESDDDSKKHPELIAAFVEIDDLVDASRGFFDRLRALEKWTERSDVLLAFFIYTGGTPAPEWDMEGRPWNRTVLFWFRGTFERLEGLAVRTRIRVAPGPHGFSRRSRRTAVRLVLSLGQLGGPSRRGCPRLEARTKFEFGSFSRPGRAPPDRSRNSVFI